MADGYYDGGFACQLKRYIGQTVTIFTTSGGLSGSGFTGVVIYVDDCVVRLLTRFGGAPDCPIGSACDCFGAHGRRGYGNGYYNCNTLGSVTEIPIDRIASFVHNAI